MRSVHLLFIAIVGLHAYLLRLRAPYVADDYFIFYRLQQGGAFGFASQPPTSFFRPFISLHYYLDYLVGMSPVFSHLVNVFWHTACGLLVYALAYRLLVRWGWRWQQAQWAAFTGALLFTALPANVEAVAWFASRADMVATAGALGALLLLMHFQKDRRWGVYLSALLCFTVGLFCKESLLSFPIMAWLWLRYLGVERAGRLAAPFLGVLLVYLVARTLVVGGVGAYPEAWGTLQRPWMLVVNLLAYLFQMGIPAIFYGLGRDLWDTLLWGAWLAGAGCLFFVWRTLPERSLQVDGRLLVGFVLLALLPVLIFKPSPLYFLNSRYSYLASAFGAVGVGAFLAQLRRQSGWARGALALLLAAYYLGTLRQVDAWRVAGEIARRSVLSLQRAPADQPLLILSLPDHFHGAYIWRAGFHEGVAVLLPERANQPLYVASRFTMRLRTNTAVQYANGVATLSSSNDIFLPPEGVRTPPGDEPIVLPDKLVIHWSLIQQHTLLGYEAGQFLIPEPQEVQSPRARRD
ncbi:MAG: hypothetical protein N2651_10080 [Fimbriimonadales bacterium]|nr:hypothetical protein [Fimbriimonadales bacterium]